MSSDDILLSKTKKPKFCLGDLVIREDSDDLHLYVSNSPAGTDNVKLLNLRTGTVRFFQPHRILRLAISSTFLYDFKIGDELELNSIYKKGTQQYAIKEFGNLPRSLEDLIHHHEYAGSSIEPYIACLFNPNVKLSVHNIVDDHRMHVKMAFPNLSHSFGLFSKNNFQLKKKEPPPQTEKIGYQVGDLVVHKDCRSPSLPSLCVEIDPYNHHYPYDSPIFKLVNIYDGDIHHIKSNGIYGLATPRKKEEFKIGDEVELSDFYSRCKTIFHTIEKNINHNSRSQLDNFTQTLLLISNPKNKVHVCNLYPGNRIRVKVQSDKGSFLEDFSANNFQLKVPQKEEIEARPVKTVEKHPYIDIFKIKSAEEVVVPPRPNIFARKFQSIKEALERLL